MSYCSRRPPSTSAGPPSSIAPRAARRSHRTHLRQPAPAAPCCSRMSYCSRRPPSASAHTAQQHRNPSSQAIAPHPPAPARRCMLPAAPCCSRMSCCSRRPPSTSAGPPAASHPEQPGDRTAPTCASPPLLLPAVLACRTALADRPAPAPASPYCSLLFSHAVLLSQTHSASAHTAQQHRTPSSQAIAPHPPAPARPHAPRCSLLFITASQCFCR
jgi:hypothetical protein